MIRNWFSHDEYFKFHVLKSILITGRREFTRRVFHSLSTINLLETARLGIITIQLKISLMQQFLTSFLRGGNFADFCVIEWIGKMQVEKWHNPTLAYLSPFQLNSLKVTHLEHRTWAKIIHGLECPPRLRSRSRLFQIKILEMFMKLEKFGSKIWSFLVRSKDLRTDQSESIHDFQTNC